jgi:hypothetical protein
LASGKKAFENEKSEGKQQHAKKNFQFEKWFRSVSIAGMFSPGLLLADGAQIFLHP